MRCVHNNVSVGPTPEVEHKLNIGNEQWAVLLMVEIFSEITVAQ